MWLLQKGLYEGTRACWRPFMKEHSLSEVLYAFVFASLGQCEEKNKHCLETSLNNSEFWKNCKTSSKKN